MVAAKKIRCVVMVAEPGQDRIRTVVNQRLRPSDLLPWADPHIRSLVTQLQEEVRAEVATRQPAGIDAARLGWAAYDELAAGAA